MLTLFAIVAEHTTEHGSKTAFYVAAGVFAAFAVLVGVVGVLRPAFPRGDGGARAVMLASTVLMVATLATAVITA
jgi:hypothetical protein